MDNAAIGVLSQVLNFLYFAVGLAVGVVGLVLSVRFFTAQQQDKFNQIASDLAKIREALSGMAEITSERAFAREERLLNMAAREQTAIVGATFDATDQLKAIVRDQLEAAGIADAVQRT